MPTVYDRRYLTSVTTQSELYATGADKTSAINSLRIFNQGVTTATFTVEFWPLGVSGNAVEILHDVDLDADEAFEGQGHLCMLETDELQVASDVALDVTADFLEKADTDPAPTRTRTPTAGVTTQQTVYTAPATKRATVTGVIITNVSGSSSTISISRFSGATEIETLGSTVLGTTGAKATYGRAVTWTLRDAETLKVTATNAVDVLISALEH